MKVTITVKEVNSGFDQAFADEHYNGQETDDNMKYNWEDEFEVKGDVVDFKVKNNTGYVLAAMKGEEKLEYEIPSMMIVECTDAAGTVTQFAASRNLVKDSKKNIDKNGNVHFYIFLKSGKQIVNPVTGIYIVKNDFPFELPVPEADELSYDDEEE